jgi:hypothetical protein
MTFDAESRLRAREKIIIVGAVRQVTGLASIRLQNFMDHLLFIVCRLVALRAHCIAFFPEQGFSLGGMGVVTAGAGRLFHGGVHLCLVQSYFFPGMTGKAEVIPRPLEEQFGNSAMPEMTFIAFFLLDHAMDVFHTKILVGKFLVALETVFLFKALLGERGVRCRQKNRSSQKKEQSDEKRVWF